MRKKTFSGEVNFDNYKVQIIAQGMAVSNSAHCFDLTARSRLIREVDNPKSYVRFLRQFASQFPSLRNMLASGMTALLELSTPHSHVGRHSVDFTNH